VSETKSNGGIARDLFENYALYRDPRVLNPECAEFMLGGTEALTYDLVHVFYGLMNNPDVFAKLREEVDMLKIDHEQVWDDSRVINLKYLVRTSCLSQYGLLYTNTRTCRMVLSEKPFGEYPSLLAFY
jgi:cytochrome P450